MRLESLQTKAGMMVCGQPLSHNDRALRNVIVEELSKASQFRLQVHQATTGKSI
jgi:hypothetical protein